ncbi:MAG: integrase arm-type DNA-binding domain-containing protein [Proteobacteria bacterium]|nr:integrase arm-type DNA-binding domain-containing protein [Pseudomonadota bacterium]
MAVKVKSNQLTVVEVKAKPAGRYADERGLYLLVKTDGRRTWVFRYRDRITGKLRDKGLGAFPEVTLDSARTEAGKQRDLLRQGGDPIDKPREDREENARKRAQEALERARARTFGDCCASYISAHEAGWRNAKHRDQWRNTLNTYAAKLLPLPVQDIDTDLVVDVLDDIWKDKTETATRVRQRLEAVLDWATARKYRQGENPARWRGHLDKLLAKPMKVKRVKHHAAMPYAEVPDFMAMLASKDSIASRALRFQILTASRSREAAGTHWAEIDLQRKVWTTPAERMKAGRDHRVPLSHEAVKLLQSMPGAHTGYVFPGGKPNRPITIAATLKVVKDAYSGLTAHGFRSSFRDWCAERTSYAREVAEAALAHAIKDQTEAAYNRTDLLEKRARMMADWGRFCCTPIKSADKVTPIRRVAASRPKT